MNILRIQSVGQLTTSANHTRTKVTGILQIGATNSVNNFSKDTHTSYVRKVIICDTAGTATLDLTDASVTGSAAYVAPVAQSRQVVATGTVTTAGTVFFRVTGTMYSALPGGYKSISVTVPTGVASVWGTTVREAVQANTAFTNEFVVSGTGDTIILTRIVDDYGYANDATLEIQIFATGTAVGASTSASTNIANGALATGVLWEETDTVDAEGVDLPAMESTAAGTLINCTRGVGIIEDDAADVKIPVVNNFYLLLSNGNTTDVCGFDTSIIATCSTPPLEVIYTIAAKIA